MTMAEPTATSNTSDSASSDPLPKALPDIAAALRLFDETTRALEARSRRLEEILIVKQQALQKSNTLLEEKVQELDNVSAYLNLLMASVSAGVIATNQDLIITTCNPAAEHLLQSLACDLIESEYSVFFADNHLKRVLQEGCLLGPYEHNITGVQGESRILSAKASPIRDTHGQIIGAVEIFEDVTEIRLLQEQAERGERLKALGEMAAGVAHEIRNPLNGIGGFASLLKRDIAEDDPCYRYVNSIDEGVRHLNNTVTSLLEFTSPKEPQCRNLPPVEIVRDCIDLLESAHRDHQYALHVDFTDRWGDRLLSCDGSQIRQVILNVLNNAAQACMVNNPDAQLRVSMRANEYNTYFELTIEDNGPGIPEQQRKNIFTPFFTTKDDGTGLGLAISHSIINLHGGTLTVDESPALGGARFTVLLPLDLKST
ncbi:MAG: PAS domain-containing protein [Planctomycetes bacterium]|nr:PAS domain-containing protein [Planctomycetota bacterium]